MRKDVKKKGYTVEKAFRYSRPQAGCQLPNSPWGGNYDVIYKLFLPRESLVSDIPAGDGNIEKLILQCTGGERERGGGGGPEKSRKARELLRLGF
jgi:hypothetical protein